jgi:hypothetical protein
MANSQSPQRPDLQDLVAYIQGRGSETLRAQVLKRLDEDEAYMDLMIDLVPMLREAGECVDPDGEAEPVPAPLRLAPPPMAEAAPAVAAPAGGKVIAAPDRFRTPRLFEALAALLPIAIGVWLVMRTPQLGPQELAHNVVAQLEPDLKAENPFDPVLRSGNQKPALEGDFVTAGTHLLDLENAIVQRNADAALDRLFGVKGSLDALAYDATFSKIATLLEKPSFTWDDVNKEMAETYEYLEREFKGETRDIKTGMCWRAAWLAANAKNESFFAGGPCRDLVGKENWVADTEALKAAFDKMKSTRGH